MATNYERIKNMTVDDMVQFLWKTRINDCGISSYNECKTCFINGFCQNGYLEKNIKQWLLSEVE